MTGISFDLEEAQCRLKEINSLLNVFQEICVKEFRLKDEHTRVPLDVAEKIHQYISVIGAAQDKVLALEKEMDTAIENYYAEAKRAKASGINSQ